VFSIAVILLIYVSYNCPGSIALSDAQDNYTQYMGDASGFGGCFKEQTNEKVMQQIMIRE